MNRPNFERFPFISKDTRLGNASLMPYLPLKLFSNTLSFQTEGLLDTGASVNVLPYSIGLELGTNWDELTTPLNLTGNLSNFPAKAILLEIEIGSLPKTQQIFAWTQSDNVPLLLGQVNFFMEFDVFLSRSQHFFDISKKVV